MTEALGVVLVVTWFAGGLIIPVYGGIISRKAYREHGWAEARLASYAFFGMIVILVLGLFAWPIIAWLSGEVVSSAALYAGGSEVFLRTLSWPWRCIAFPCV